MKVQKISILPLLNDNYQNKRKQTTTNPAETKNNLPVYAYKDFNISFSGGRTPEDFYQQEFNVKGMPDSMKDYLYDDFEDRQFMPPSQIMRTVFEDVNKLEKLDDVKRIYPDEPLFQTLHDKPSIVTRTIKEIDLMSDGEMRPFKTSNDTLGMYLLKKIYLEGKTLDEIQKSFVKDLSVHYKGVSPLDYNTLRAYGIYFPNKSFWHSFIATRQDYTINHKPRKAIESRIKTNNSDNTSTKPRAEKPKFNLNDREVNDITDAIVKSRGNKSETAKQLKRKGIKEQDSKLHFIQRYLSEIMSVSLEKTHASDEMRNFFGDYENLPKNQKEKLEAYWKRNPYMREMQSQAISDTIKLFFLTYGADGNNEEFQELLDYARSIKPQREENDRLHNEKQLYYEEVLKDFDPETAFAKPQNIEDNIIDNENNLKTDKDLNTKNEILAMTDSLDAHSANFKEYNYTIGGENFNLYADLNTDVTRLLADNLRIFPSEFTNSYTNFVLRHPIANQDYKMALILHATKENIEYPFNVEDFCTEEKLLDKTKDINDHFERKYANEISAGIQAFIDGFFKYYQDEYLSSRMFARPLADLIPLKNMIGDSLTNVDNYMNARYLKYKKPLSESETKSIVNEIIEILKEYTPEKTSLGSAKGENDMSIYIYALSRAINSKHPEARSFKHKIADFIKNEYGGSARFLLDSDNEKMKIGKVEEILSKYGNKHSKEFFKYILLSPEGIGYAIKNSSVTKNMDVYEKFLAIMSMLKELN